MARAKETEAVEETAPTGGAVANAAPPGQIVTIVPAGLPAALGDAMLADAGRGTSQAAEDNIIPLIYILQAQSPQVLPRNPKQIPGAAASNIWLRNAPVATVDGEQGILFQPCYFGKDWVEWKPRDDGGGFIARHATLPDDATKTEDPKNPNRVTFKRPNGNEVIETRYHYGIVYGGEAGLKAHPGLVMPYVIPMSGSGHTVSRTWMGTMNQFTMPGTDKVYPSWARRYILKTVVRKNAAGEWFTWAVSDGGWVPTQEDYMRGRALYESIARGEKRAESDVGDAGEGTGETGGI